MGQWVGGGEGGGEDDARAHQVSSEPSPADHQVSSVLSWIVFPHLISPIGIVFCSNVKIIYNLVCSADTFILGSKENFPTQRLLREAFN